MIIKNLTFVIPLRQESAFLALAFRATDALSNRVEDIRAYKLMEQVDPETFNFAIQLAFSNTERLESFNREVLEDLLGEIEAGIDGPLLYFESHLRKIF